MVCVLLASGKCVCPILPDRHWPHGVATGRPIICEGEPGEVQTLTYQQLMVEVCKFANVLKSLGTRKGGRTAIYMGCPRAPHRHHECE